ncbi:MAG: hypothetical protein ACE366_23960 [Bradymonadia bacterium]
MKGFGLISSLCVMVLLSGCGSAGKVQVQPLGPERASTRDAHVEFIEGLRGLPAGFFYVEDPMGRKAHLHAVAEYPTLGSPHQVIGALLIQNADRLLAPLDDEARSKLRARATTLGANRIFFPNARRAFGYAIWVSNAQPSAHHLGLEGITRQREALSGWTPVSEPIQATLDDAQIVLEGEAGFCHQLLVSLDQDAQWAEGASRGLAVVREGRKLLVRQSLGEIDGFPIVAPTGGRYVGLHAFSQPLGCLKANTTQHLTLTDRLGKAAGRGDVWLQLVRRPRRRKGRR